MSVGHSTRWRLLLIHMLLLLVFRTEGEIIEGDIVTDEDQTHTYGSFEMKTWPNGEVPYFIHSPSVKENVLTAMHLIEERTSGCIDFIPRNQMTKNYINITSDSSGCSSSVAPKGGGQRVIIGPGCNTIGIIIHELLHALGFWHEHSRPDRDEYVKIYRENMIQGTFINFKTRRFPDILLEVPYDYYSILHYKYNEFAKVDTETTIAPRDPSVHKEALGQRERLSFYDVRKIQKLYNCPDYNRNPDACTPLDYNDVTVILTDFVLEVGVVVKFSCPESLSLIGPENSTCQQALTWSGAVPFCVDNESGLLTYCDMGDCLSAWDLTSFPQAIWTRRQDESDHTYGNYRGSFLSSEKNYALAKSPWIQLKSNDGVSIMFYHRMSENSTLLVYMMMNNKWQRVCTERGSQNDTWYQSICSVTKVSGKRIKIAFVTQRIDPKSSIWIDDFVFGPSTEIEKYKQHIEGAVSQGKPPEHDEFEP